MTSLNCLGNDLLALSTIKLISLYLLVHKHDLCTVLHASKIRFFAFEARVESALVHSIIEQSAVVERALGYYWSLSVQSFFKSNLYGLHLHFDFKFKVFVKQVAELWCIVRDFHFFLTSRTVKVAKCHFDCGMAIV